jgi:hypothetical protein
MSLDSDLRDMLTEQADRLDGPVPDIVAIRAGGLRMRRRRRSAVVASSGLAVLLSLGVGLGIAAGQRDNAAGDLPVGQPSGASTSTEVPWCVPDPGGGQRILGEGAPIRTLCHEIHEGRLWHHAGTTVLVRSGTVQRVADGRVTPLGTGDGNVSMSHDGRLVAWLSCGVHPLEVYEVATATRVATTEVDSASCGHVAGIDDLGRVYVTVDDQTGVLDVRMYDIRRREWSQVVGLPVDGGTVTYVTADGFALQSEKVVVTAPGYGDTLPVASVEGRVDDAGRFVPQREVPIGRGRWSPDRSLVVDQQAEGVVVHSADLTTRVVLDLPTASFTRTADRLPDSDFLWESPTAVLAVGDIARGSRVYRCDVRSGTCELVDRPGWPPFGNNALVGG